MASPDGALVIGTQMLFTVGPNQHVNGTVKYVGPLEEDATGQEWVGVELAEPVGRHSGRQYFSCKQKHGLFVKAATALSAAACSSEVRLVKPLFGPLFTQYFSGLEAAAADAGVPLLTTPPQRLGGDDAILIIDLQYDFLPGGAFGVPEGNDTIQPISGLIGTGAAVGATVICTRDYHPADHASFIPQGGPFPPHCLQGGRTHTRRGSHPTSDCSACALTRPAFLRASCVHRRQPALCARRAGHDDRPVDEPRHRGRRLQGLA